MDASGVTVESVDLADVITRTLSEVGMDRMTDSQIEETLACSALTAHYQSIAAHFNESEISE